MSKLTQLKGVETFRLLRTEIDAALKPLAEKFGIIMKAGQGTYTPGGTTATIKLEMGVIGEDGKPDTKEADAYRRTAGTYGLKPEWLDQEFPDPYGRGDIYIVRGLRLNAKRNIVSLESKTTGKKYVVDATLVIAGFEKKAKAEGVPA